MFLFMLFFLVGCNSYKARCERQFIFHKNPPIFGRIKFHDDFVTVDLSPVLPYLNRAKWSQSRESSLVWKASQKLHLRDGLVLEFFPYKSFRVVNFPGEYYINESDVAAFNNEMDVILRRTRF
jgi:hypothetical protein